MAETQRDGLASGDDDPRPTPPARNAAVEAGRTTAVRRATVSVWVATLTRAESNRERTEEIGVASYRRSQMPAQ